MEVLYGTQIGIGRNKSWKIQRNKYKEERLKKKKKKTDISKHPEKENITLFK